MSTNVGTGSFLRSTWCRASLVFIEVVFGLQCWLLYNTAMNISVFDQFRCLRSSLTCSFLGIFVGSFSINFCDESVHWVKLCKISQETAKWTFAEGTVQHPWDFSADLSDFEKAICGKRAFGKQPF